MMNFNESAEFKKDIKRYAKKWRSLPNDIEAVKANILPLYVQMSDDVSMEWYRRAFFNNKRATIISTNEKYEIVKIRLDVESLGTNSKTRVIFVAVKFENTITFLELYAKNDKSNPDVQRYKQYL